MLDFGHLPTGNGASDVQMFMAPGEFTWMKPRGKTMAFIWLVGGGSGGGAGAGGTAAAAKGGGGGGQGGSSIRNLIPLALIPDRLRVVVGAGGAGGIGVSQAAGGNGSVGGLTSVDYLVPGAAALAAMTSSMAATGGLGGAATGGSAGTAVQPGNNLWGSALYVAQNSNPGSAGVITGTGGAGASANNSATAGGGGGGGCPITTPAVQAGGVGLGNISYNNFVAPNPLGGTGDAGAGGSGIAIFKPGMWPLGASGGGGASSIISATTVGGKGGDGTYGCGGGGGGAASNAAATACVGGNGGKGGDGYAMIVCW